MLNTCVTSRISLRTRASSSFSTNDYSYCSNEAYPFTYSSSRQCCSCCSYTVYKVPLTPSYCYNLYGLRQSSLIQWSPYRRLVRSGLDRCYNARLPVCDVDGSCFCDRICNFREKSVGVRKRGLRKCLVYEERSERYDFGGFDEAEAVLSLLTDDVDEECFRVTKETRKYVKKPVAEKRENGEVSNRSGSKKKQVDIDVLESEHRCECGSVVRSRKRDNTREEIIRRREEKEALLREENERVALREERKNASLKNRIAREEEREALLRKKNQKVEENKKRESMLRKENWKVRSRTEDREDLLREEPRQKLKKDGSSCSSYYSFSSTGDNDSDNEIEHTEGRLLVDSSSGHKRNSRSNEIVYEDSKEEDQRHEDYREDNVVSLTKKSTGKELYTGSSVMESDHRKKSEKSFADVSVEEIESRRRISQKESNISLAHENNHKKSSDYYEIYDDAKVKSTGSTKFDQDSRQQLRQTDEDVLRQSETRMKYKQLAERQDTRSDDVRASYGSQKVYSGKSEMSAKVASSSQETVAEQKAVQLSTIEDRYQRNSRKVAKVSEIQEIDITKTSMSQLTSETNFNEENYSTNILSSINSAAKQQQQQQQLQQQQQQQQQQQLQQQQQRDQVSAQVESGSKSQQLTKKDGKSILKGESDKLIKQEDNVNLVHGSSSESRERRSQIHANESDESTEILVSQSGNTGAIYIEDTNDAIREIPERSPSRSPEIGTSSLWSGARTAANDVREGSLQLGSTELHRTDSERSSEFQRKASVGANGSQGQTSKFISHEDAIGSAERLEKSSAHYVDQFVDQVRNELLISETEREKKTSETKSVHEEQQKQKNSAQYISGDYQPKEQRVVIGDDRRSGRKGPTDEMWTVNEPSNQDPSRAEAQDDASEAETAIAKRTGRSLWNVFSDVVRLRWSPRSESHSSGRKTGERSSPNQSTSSEAWFSGHEAEQHEEATEEKEGRSITQGSSGSYQEEKTGSTVEEGSSSSTSEGHPKHLGINEPASSVVLGRVSPPISLPSGGEITEGSFGGTSSNAIVHFSLPLPAMRMRRSHAVLRGDLEAGEVNTSGSGMSEQLNTGSVEKQESTVNEGELKRRKLQRKNQIIQDRFDEWEDAYRLDAEQRKTDEFFMREALLEAQKAADKWEVPVGAVLVHNGKIIARGYNLVEELRDSTAHAEIICIREGSNILKTWRLSETTLYVTLEPCPMCAGAILQARIDVVVWGAPNKLLGADGSWIRLFPNGDGGNGLEQSDKPPAPVHPFHPKIIIRRGVLATECADAMQQFFKLRRRKDKKTDPSSSTSAATPPACLPITHRPSSSKFLAKMHNAFNLLVCL